MFKRGEIYYIEPYYTTGSEQKAGRPAVIVSNEKNNEYSSTVEVVYLTTKPKHDLPTHVTVRGTGRDSIALCEQITSVAIERLGEYCGECNNQELAAIDTALMISLDLSMGNVQEKVVEVVKEVPVEVIKEVPTVVGVGNAEEVTDLRCKLATANAQLEMMQKMYNDLLVKAMT